MLIKSSWRTQIPSLSGISEEVSNLLDRRAQTLHLKEGSVIFGPANPAENLLLLASGTVRVQQKSETGREVILHRVHAGESCVLTTGLLLDLEACSAEGIAETDVEAVLIPLADVNALMSMSKEFRAFVFDAYSKRITDLFLVIEERASKHKDVRLASSDPSTACHRIEHFPRSQLREFERLGGRSFSRRAIDPQDSDVIGRHATIH